MILTSISIGVNSKGTSRSIIRNPTLLQSQSADSVHVLAFTSHGELLVAESEGNFTLEDWEEVYEVGKEMCCDSSVSNDMQDGGMESSGDMMRFIKSSLQAKVAADLHWKD